jgi:hypothetical protein
MKYGARKLIFTKRAVRKISFVGGMTLVLSRGSVTRQL